MAPPKPSSLPQVKVDFNKAAGHKPPKTPPPPALKLNPPQRAVAKAPAPGVGRIGPPAAQAKPAAAKAPQAAAQTQRALQMKRDFARAAAQRKGGKGKTQEKQHTKQK